ncbi:hypothetical protein U1Q18_019877, partial [Sarracenia purpurea var. burkii]
RAKQVVTVVVLRKKDNNPPTATSFSTTFPIFYSPRRTIRCASVTESWNQIKEMGNCLFGVGGFGEVNDDEVIKVVTSNGGIMEFNGAITAECITDEFPGHGIFRSRDLFWKPLPHHQLLLPGESYYLLPLNTNKGTLALGYQIPQVGHVRSSSEPATLVASAVPYRMSFEGQGMLRRSYAEEEAAAFPGFYDGVGRVWKVKLVITPRQLLNILSEEGPTQELIESVRTVAKCGNIRVSSSAGSSDQWSLSSSRNASSTSKKDGSLLEI